MTKYKKSAMLAAASLGTALIAVCSFVAIPTPFSPAPVTLQSFAVCVTASLLGKYFGTLATICYIALGAVGVPVFAGIRGGIGTLMSATGGYIIGFVLTALAVGIICDTFGRTVPVCIAGMTVGIIMCYTVGTAWFVLVYSPSQDTSDVGILYALSRCVLPFILPDAVKILVAAVISAKIFPRIPILQKQNREK